MAYLHVHLCAPGGWPPPPGLTVSSDPHTLLTSLRMQHALAGQEKGCPHRGHRGGFRRGAQPKD